MSPAFHTCSSVNNLPYFPVVEILLWEIRKSN